MGLDLSWTRDSSEGSNYSLLGADLHVILALIVTMGVNFAVSFTQGQPTPFLGFSLGVFDMPPIQFWGWRLLKLTLRWDLATGEGSAMVGIFSAAIGVSNLLVAGESYTFPAPR